MQYNEASTVNIPDFIAKGFLNKETAEHANQIVRKLNGYPSVEPGKDISGNVSLLKIYGTLLGGGKYIAQIVKGRFIPGDLSIFCATDTLMTASAGLIPEHPVYLVNMLEDQTNQHELIVDQHVIGLFVGMASDGYAIYFTQCIGKLGSGQYPGTIRQVSAANSDTYDYLHATSLVPGAT